jgi:PD-(D/E)XK nuclease superfamily protein
MNSDRRCKTIRASDRESSLMQEALTRQIIGTFFEVYDELGGGFLESVYKEAMSLVRSERHSPLAGDAAYRVVPWHRRG